MQFNARLQARLNSSQNMHRGAMGVGAGGGGSSSADFASSSSAGGGGSADAPAPGHLDDLTYDGGAGAGTGAGADGDMNELVWIRRELRQKKAKIASLQNHFESVIKHRTSA